MAAEGKEKEVRFDIYCKKCKSLLQDENFQKCHKCLKNASNIDSHRPTEFEPREKMCQK